MIHRNRLVVMTVVGALALACVAAVSLTFTDDTDGTESCTDTAKAVVYSSADEIAAGRLGILDPTPEVALPGPDDVRFNEVPVNDPSWRMYWLGLTWLIPLAADGHPDLAAKYAETFHDQTTSTLPDVPGWDEGTNLRRLQSLLCIRSFKRTDKIDAAIDQSIDAAKDPSRYPNIPIPNNHVIMINRALIDAGKQLRRPELISFALDRLANDWRVAWAPEVYDLEQSASYVAGNVGMWTVVAKTFRMYDRAREADALEARLEIAKQGVRLLMTPKGPIVPYGDSGPIKVDPSTVSEGGPLSLIDPAAGVAAGRTSWDDSATHWTLRFGPPRAVHGHTDAMSVTWDTNGESVLVDPGNFGYGRNKHADWDHNPQAHNVAVPVGDGSKFIRGTTTPLVDHSSDDVATRFTLRSFQFNVPQLRRITIFHNYPVIAVVDVADGPLVQHWHLDQTWTPEGESWKSKFGSLLHLVSTASEIEAFEGNDKGGWVFPKFGVAEPSQQVDISGDGSITTAWALGGLEVRVSSASITIEGATYPL